MNGQSSAPHNATDQRSGSQPKAMRWGIIGAGHIALHAVAPAIRYSSNGVLHALASRSQERADRLAREAQAEVAHGSYEALLADDRVEAVYIGLPDGLHERWAVAAARAGKHVLCEKSLALHAASAERVKRASAEAGVRVMEAFMYRHHPQWNIVRRLIAEGSIGTLRSVHGWLCGSAPDGDHRWEAGVGGGALSDVTAYGIDMARFVTGEEPVGVVAQASLRGDVDASSSVVMRFGSGVLATASGSLCSAPSQGLRLLGDGGEIVVRSPVVTTFAPTRIELRRGDSLETIEGPGANHFLHEVEHFAACVLDPERSLWPGEDGVANAWVREAARASFLTV